MELCAPQLSSQKLSRPEVGGKILVGSVEPQCDEVRGLGVSPSISSFDSLPCPVSADDVTDNAPAYS